MGDMKKYIIETKGKNKKIINLFKELGGDIACDIKYYTEEFLCFDENIIFQRVYNNHADLKDYELITLKDLKLLVSEKKLKDVENQLKECKDSKVDFDIDYSVKNESTGKCCGEEPKPFKREVGKVYILKEKGIEETAIIYCTNKGKDSSFGGYGMDDGNWSVCDNWSAKCIIREATDKEWLDALTKEAEKKGFKEGVTFKSCVSGTIFTIQNNKITCDDAVSGFYLFIDGMCLMKDGVWAKTYRVGGDINLANLESAGYYHWHKEYIEDNPKQKISHDKQKAIDYINQRDWVEGELYYVSDSNDRYPIIMKSCTRYGYFKDKKTSEASKGLQWTYFKKFNDTLPEFN